MSDLASRSSGEPSAIPEEPFIAEYELAAISNFESLLADSFGEEQATAKLDDLDTIVSLLNRLRSGGIPRSLSEEPTLGDVLAWLRGRPGSSWVATIQDIEEAVAALRSVPRVCGDPDCICAIYAPLGLPTHRPSFRPSSERAVSDEERRDISELEGIRDGLRKSAIHKRDGARVTPDDYLRNTWNDKADEHDRQADFWQRIIDRLVPSPGDKGSGNG